VTQINPALPAELNRILGKALEKDRNLRYQTATDLKTDLLRLKRDLDSGGRGPPSSRLETVGRGGTPDRSVAVLYFENQRREGRRVPPRRRHRGHHHGALEDRGLKIFSRPTVLPYRDKPVTPAQVGQQLKAAYVLAGSIRRAGNRLRITAQLVDTRPTFRSGPSATTARWKDVFEVQDEIARKIAEALRITLSPQEQEALAAKPTETCRPTISTCAARATPAG
jgi:hypothetical protein